MTDTGTAARGNGAQALIDEIIASYKTTKDATATTEEPLHAPLAWPELQGKPVPVREWVWPGWIPAYTVTLLHGFGGVGKTLLSQQIGTAAGCGSRLFGSQLNVAGPVIGWFGEDDHDELWRRQVAINEALGIGSLAELDGRLYWRSCSDRDITLFTGQGDSEIKRTPRYEALRKEISDVKAKLVILDSVSQIYAGSENSRSQVTRCVSLLLQLAIELDTTFVIIGHNSKPNGGAGGTYSGSTAWENKVRSRLALTRSTTKEDGEEEIPGLVTLRRPKANYAGKDDVGIELRWAQSAFFATAVDLDDPVMREYIIATEEQHDELFLAALRRLTGQGRSISEKACATYAPKVILDAMLNEGLSKSDLKKAMNRLFNAGRIVSGELPWTVSNGSPAKGLREVLGTTTEF